MTTLPETESILLLSSIPSKKNYLYGILSHHTQYINKNRPETGQDIYKYM